MSVFGIWPIFEMHRGMWPGYSFSRFQERFWHFAHFVITQRHVVRSYIFSFSRAFLAFGPFSKYTEACGPIIFFLVFISVFFAFVGFKLFWHFAHFRNVQEACAPVIFFLVFMHDLKKVIQVNFRSVVQLK